MTTHVALIIPEGVQTSDKRFIEEGALTWRETIPLMGLDKTTDGHDEALHVGNATNLRRVQLEGVTWIVGDVTYDSDAQAVEFQRLADEEKINGISADLGDVTAEIEITETDDAGNPVDGREVITAGEVMGATQLPMPAFAGAKIVTAEAFAEMTPSAVTAAANPQATLEWFLDPELDSATPLKVTDDGRIFGHLATWGTCHTAFDGACVTAPTEPDYSYFHTGIVKVEGAEVAVGHITMHTGHASLRYTAEKAKAHYDDTGTCVADVSAGADEYGIWVAGAARPDADLHALRAASLSGDWRRIDGSLRLSAALAVNVPGFPIPRIQARVASAEPYALVASGLVRQADPPSDLQLVAAALAKLNEKLDGFVPVDVNLGDNAVSSATGRLAALLDQGQSPQL